MSFCFASGLSTFCFGAKKGKTMQNLTDSEYAALIAACRNVPPAQGDYRIDDFVENLLLTVTDFQMHTKAVERARKHFQDHVQAHASDLASLKIILSQYLDDKEGNTALAQRLWGYKLWSRAGMLRRLVEFFEAQGVVDQPGLERWAFKAQFKPHADTPHFEGQVSGLGIAVFHWLVMRQGVETIKPDVHVLRFVEKAIGRPVKPEVVVKSLIRAAQELGIVAYKLDWAIWEQGRAGS
jgi:hypothetical protein